MPTPVEENVRALPISDFKGALTKSSLVNNHMLTPAGARPLDL